MIRHAWSVLCERVVTDKHSNNVTLSVVEQIALRHAYQGNDQNALVKLPLVGILVTLWYKDEGDATKINQFRIRLRSFAGKYVGEATGQIDFGDKERARTFTQFSEIPAPIEGTGRIFFVVEHRVNGKWKKDAEIPFMVQISRVAEEEVAKRN